MEEMPKVKTRLDEIKNEEMCKGMSQGVVERFGNRRLVTTDRSQRRSGL